jgi:hypothetical protein
MDHTSSSLLSASAFPTLFRSDHYFIGRQQDSLEAYPLLRTRRPRDVHHSLRPTRLPRNLPVARRRRAAWPHRSTSSAMAASSWASAPVGTKPEHTAYGIPFPPVKERFDRLEEAIQVIKTLWAPGPGLLWRRPLPAPGRRLHPQARRSGRPPILIGGGGEKRTLKLVARYAAEWNAVNLVAGRLPPQDRRPPTATAKPKAETPQRSRAP